ncbi:MAG: DUF4178 domain-containing protein, partial [Gemmataceae bacterium]|nr:DUF4178 domain-containing protein [Gemmataceae bacterium]
PYCRSVVARGDRGLESLGKVADLVESQSPLDTGVKGKWAGKGFDLLGRTQFNHPAGGVWDEWYLSFPDGKWGWLAEAGGRFYLTFDAETPADLPAYDDLQLGQKIELGGNALVVAEKNRATVGGAKGEMPSRVVPGALHPFADLSGPGGLFGTLDYSGPAPKAYLGREVTLDELGIPKSARRTYPGQGPTIQALALNCPNCAAALSLRAPDASERVGCPSCGSLLDVKGGKLSLLQTLKKPNVEPVIPLGAKGTRDGVEWECLGFLQRAVTFEEVDYFWEEYLLQHPRLGFRWLTRSDDHWNWVEPLPPGAVAGDGKHVSYAGRPYSLFQKATARVTAVYGEFYWKVQAGEKVECLDYVSAPYQLSSETTQSGTEGEINWSGAEYVAPDEVRKMFGLKEPLHPPSTIGPNQPFPYTAVYGIFLRLAALALLLGAAWWLLLPPRTVLDERFALALPKESKDKKASLERTVELRGWRNLRITLTSHSSGWVAVRGSFSRVAEAPTPDKAKAGPAAKEAFAFYALPGRYDYVYLSALPAGDYVLTLEFTWQTPEQPSSATLLVRSGVPHPSPIVYTLLFLAIPPFLVGIWQLVWESRRWADSNAN